MMIEVERKRALRKQYNIIQKELVNRLINYYRRAYGYYESGLAKIPVDKLKVFSIIFNISTDSLLGLIDYKRPLNKNYRG